MTTGIDELDQIRTAFAAASIPGPRVLSDAVAALRTLLVALIDPNGLPACDDAVYRLVTSIFAAGPVVAEAAAPQMRSDDVHIGMAAASRLAVLLKRHAAPNVAGEPNQALVRAWADHAALLAFELDALLRRRSIEARGDVFRRSIVIDRARAATGDGLSLH